MLKPTKRFITGIDSEQQSKILLNTEIETLVPYSAYPCFQLQNLFYTEENPQSLTTEPLEKPYDINLPEGAMRFMKIRMPTKKEMIAALNKAGEAIPTDWTKFNIHSTDSVDYIYILSGAITCVVGNQQFALKSGDFLAQIGPEHTWINDHDEACYILCVMVGIKPSGSRLKMSVE